MIFWKPILDELISMRNNLRMNNRGAKIYGSRPAQAALIKHRTQRIRISMKLKRKKE